MKYNRLTRRDRCFVTGSRAIRLTNPEAVKAWRELSTRLGEMADRDVPKFNDLLEAIRAATIQARKK